MSMNSVLTQSNKGHTLFDARTTTGASGSYNKPNLYQTFQATISNTTSPTATVDIEVSNDNSQWIVMGTISVSGAQDTDGFASNASWKYVRANVTAISGTSATVTVTMGG